MHLLGDLGALIIAVTGAEVLLRAFSTGAALKRLLWLGIACAFMPLLLQLLRPALWGLTIFFFAALIVLVLAARLFLALL